MGNKWTTKNKIMDAAVQLFDSQGFEATTIREIAQKAGVNSAMIGYYFENKKKLLEQIMITYFENYFVLLEQEMKRTTLTPAEQLKQLVRLTITYQMKNLPVTRLISRELSVESMLGREIMSTYLKKQKYFFISLLEKRAPAEVIDEADGNILFTQIYSLLCFPFVFPQIVREVIYEEPLDPNFVDRYLSFFNRYIDAVCQLASFNIPPKEVSRF
jgi:AcrR family transcriptional regulator